VTGGQAVSAARAQRALLSRGDGTEDGGHLEQSYVACVPYRIGLRVGRASAVKAEMSSLVGIWYDGHEMARNMLA